VSPTMIQGDKTEYVIVGGAGEFSRAGGSGKVDVSAQITASGPTGASGTFGPHTFKGTVSTLS
jgi:hypothetical protein